MLRSISAYSVSLVFKYKNAVFNGKQEKETIYLCEEGIEKSVPHNPDRLSSETA